jgi:transcriptional regulator GlxA family with amidase domain
MSSDFTVDVLSQLLDVRSTQLREIIHFEFHMSPHRLIETIRLAQAINLIRQSLKSNTPKDFYEISEKIGYRGTKTFRAAFERRIGLTPSGLRELMATSKNIVQVSHHIIDSLWTTTGKKRPVKRCGVLGS